MCAHVHHQQDRPLNVHRHVDVLGTTTSKQLVALSGRVVPAAPDKLSPDTWPDHDLSCGDRSSNTLAATPAACPTLCFIHADNINCVHVGQVQWQNQQLLGSDGHHNEKWLASCWLQATG
jgi:hypothetical protein